MTYIHINRGVNTHYIARVRMRGQHSYVLIGKPCKTAKQAIRRVAEEMAGGGWKRGDVLMCADYYDPVAIWEAVSK